MADTNGNGMGYNRVFADLPVWIKGVAFLIGTVGTPTVFAMWLLAKDAGFIPSTPDAQTSDHYTLMVEHNTITKEGLHLQRVQCEMQANQMKNPEEWRLKCLGHRP